MLLGSYVNCFFPDKAKLWNFFSTEYFLLTYDLNCLELTDTFSLWVLSKQPSYIFFSSFSSSFIKTPYLVTAAQPCMEWIPIKKMHPLSKIIRISSIPRRTQASLHFFCFLFLLFWLIVFMKRTQSNFQNDYLDSKRIYLY